MSEPYNLKGLEKLAYEAACGWYNEMHAMYWYMEGFKAAREMAAKLHKDGRGDTGMCDVCSDSGDQLFEEMVRHMGDDIE